LQFRIYLYNNIFLTAAGEMPYTCGTCGKMFRQNGSLYNHQKTHKELQGRKKCKAKRPIDKNKNSRQSYSELSWKNEMEKCYYVSSSPSMRETSDDCLTNNVIIATDNSVLDKIEEVR